MKMKKDSIAIAYGRKWKRARHERNHFDGIPKYRRKRIGLYVLYKNRKIVYIGKSESNLRVRIDNHTQDHLKNRWDSFSWFILRPKYTSDLEALLHKIFYKITDIKLNKVRANFIRARRYKEV